MISRRLDLKVAPEEWSAILTCMADGEVVQYAGYGMTCEYAIERALADAGALRDRGAPRRALE